MREKIKQFMYGRYGVDELGRYMLTSAMFFCILSLFFRNTLGAVFYYISILLIVEMYIRMFSRNIQRCYRQNVKFLNKFGWLKRKILSEKKIFSQRRYYHFYKCPRCNQKIRIPRGKGKIEIRCPKCGETFIKRS